MTTLALFPDPTYSRVRIIVGDAAGGTLTRDDGSGPVAVRSGDAVTGSAAIDDYEAPLDVTLTYALDGVTATTTLTGTAWLVHPTNPLLNVAVTVGDQPDEDREAPGTVHDVIGAPLPIVTWHPFRSRQSGVLTLRTTWAGRTALYTALSDSSPLLLKVPAGCKVDDGWMFLARARRVKQDPATVRAVLFELDYQRCARPGGFVTQDPTNSYAAVAAFHVDGYTELATSHPTYSHLRLTAHPHPGGEDESS